MKGTLPKRIASCHLACEKCKYFNDKDDDIFYCELDRAEFPSLCEQYEGRLKAEVNFFLGVDPL